MSASTFQPTRETRYIDFTHITIEHRSTRIDGQDGPRIRNVVAQAVEFVQTTVPVLLEREELLSN